MKSGLDYFPLDCQMDDSVKLVEAEFGLAGFAIIIKLWQDIYRGEGYYKKFDKDVRLLFSKEIDVKTEFLNEVLQCALNRDIFDKGMFEKYEILTSKGIQKRFLTITKRRKGFDIMPEYDLCNKNEENVCKNEENVYIFEQSKVKESKVKESKVKESKVKENAGDGVERVPHRTPFGEYKNVFLTDAQKESLISKLGEGDFNEYVRRLDEYIQETGKRYRDPCLTISRWHHEDKQKQARAPAKAPPKSRFNNYENTNKTDYNKATENILKELLED